MFVKTFAHGSKWLSGTILSKTGPVSYLVQLSDGGIFRRHVDHIRLRATNGNPLPVQTSPRLLPVQAQLDTHPMPLNTAEEPQSTDTTTNPESVEPEESESLEETPLRRSTRSRHVPSYLKDYVT